MTLHVAVSGWLLGTPSGANRRLQALLHHIAPLLVGDERITVLHRADVPPFATLPQVSWCAVSIAATPTLRRIWCERRLLPGIVQQVGANVLDHGFLPLPRLRVPVVLTVHDLRAAEGLTRWPRWLARRTVRDSAARAAAVVVPSDFTRRALRAFAPAAAPIVIHNGVALPPVAATPTTRPGHLLHVGHLEPRKNLEVIVRALALLPAAERPELRLVGRDAGSLGALRTLALALGVEDRLRHCGQLDDQALAVQFADARAVVVPSRYEGFGLPALEGLAHDRPVLVADAGALPEVVGAAGTVLPADDAAAWSRAIAATADATSDPARRLQAARHDWPSAAAQLLQVWRRVANADR